MTNVFEDQPDGRQSEEVELRVTRFRPRYRALTESEKALHDQIKQSAEALETLYQQVHFVRLAHGFPDAPREMALALTKLEESVMWAVKSLTA